MSTEDERMLKSVLIEPEQHKEQLSTELKSYHQQQVLKLETLQNVSFTKSTYD